MLADYFPMIDALWRKLQALGIHIMYTRLGGNSAGVFHVNWHAHPPVPCIKMHRSHAASPATEPTRVRAATAPAHLPPIDHLAELMTLAHEGGHALSYQEDHDRRKRLEAVVARFNAIWNQELPQLQAKEARNEQLRQEARTGLTDEERTMILDEEARAWDRGRTLLEEQGFDAWQIYAERRRLNLHRWQYRLGIAELPPEDGADTREIE